MQISVETQIEMSLKYGGVTPDQIKSIQNGDEKLWGQLIVNLTNALLTLEVDLEDFEHVSNMILSRFAITREQYAKFLAGNVTEEDLENSDREMSDNSGNT